MSVSPKTGRWFKVEPSPDGSGVSESAGITGPRRDHVCGGANMECGGADTALDLPVGRQACLPVGRLDCGWTCALALALFDPKRCLHPCGIPPRALHKEAIPQRVRGDRADIGTHITWIACAMLQDIPSEPRANKTIAC